MAEDYLGPNYPYHKNISTPDDMKMSPEAESLDENIVGLINYASLLMTGNTDANKKIKYEQATLGSKQPLGDRIFVKTMGNCKKKILKDGVVVEPETPGSANRYVYVDHIPTGNIPEMGNISAMKGLIPGVMDNIFKLNPIKIITAMGKPAEPDCLEVEFETIQYNKKTEKHELLPEKHWVSVDDLKSLNPCTFKSVKNTELPKISGGEVVSQTLVGDKFQHPLNKEEWKTGAYCHWMESPDGELPDLGKKDGFSNLFKMKNMDVKNSIINVKNKPIAKIFNASFGILLAYLLYKVLRKEL